MDEAGAVNADEVGARYAAPALEKGLDVIELLAGEAAGLTAGEIAQALGRSQGELYRMMNALERRGYIRRAAGSTFALTLKLFELAQRHPPTERLITAALPVMRELAATIGQSCHLAVHDDGRILVLCRVESPRPWGLMVRVGAAYTLTGNSSGRVLLAFQPEPVRRAWLLRALVVEDGPAPPDLAARIATIARQGFEAGPSDTVEGVTNLSAPVLDGSGRALAAVTVPFLAMQGNQLDPEAVLTEVRTAAETIGAQLVGSAPRPTKPEPGTRRGRPRSTEGAT
jgi:DNA-binding IclR family transcriptional regulator